MILVQYSYGVQLGGGGNRACRKAEDCETLKNLNVKTEECDYLSRLEFLWLEDVVMGQAGWFGLVLSQNNNSNSKYIKAGLS
mgnify:FL=1